MSNAPVQMAFGDSLLLSLVGIVFVFIVLAFLAVIVVVLAKIAQAVDKKTKARTGAPQVNKPIANTIEKTMPQAAAPVNQLYGGQVRLYDCSDQNAALIMAIVADNTDIPLSELVFKSIRAIED